jgi:hypothetical protein
MPITDLPDRAHSLALRLGRVDDLAMDIARACFQYAASDPLEIDERRDEGVAELYVAAVDPVPPIVSLLFSDAINQLRSSLDNALVLQIEHLRREPLDTEALRSVKFLIYNDSGAYADAIKRTVKRLPELDITEPLGRAMWELQPFQVLENIRGMEMRGGERATGPHHLTVLQEYSNADKHRRLRVSAVANATIRSATGAAELISSSRAWKVGEAVARTPVGSLDVVEIWPYVSIERALTGEIVPPGAELYELHRYVAEVVLPKLLDIEDDAFAPAIDLRTPKLTTSERMATAGAAYAHKRAGAEFVADAADILQREASEGNAVRLPRYYRERMSSAHED